MLLATLLVTTTNDAGPGSFRQAILDANAGSGGDTIAFNIGTGGVQIIRPASPLPVIAKPVTIDGTTQPGFAGKPLIDIDGSGAGTVANGLTISAGKSTVKGLVINNFKGFGIELMNNGGNLLVGNYIGTDITGEQSAPNGSGGIPFASGGILVASGNNTIGGTSAAEGNIISGNQGPGLEIDGDSNQVQGNFIGTNAAGTLLSNSGQGVDVSTGASGNTIGGLSIGGSNTVYSAAQDGIHIDTGNAIINLLGTNLIRSPTSIVSGILRLGTEVTFAGAVMVSAGATLDLSSFDFTIGSLSGTGAVTLGSATLTIGSDDTPSSFGGAISGTGGLTKVGSANLILSGSNLYSGPTTVNAGALQVMGSQAASAVTVHAGATLSGTGTVGAITANGAVSPQPGILQVGNGNAIRNAVFGPGSSFQVSLAGTVPGSAYSQLGVSGSVDLTAGPTLIANLGFASTAGDTFTILSAAGGISGTFKGLPDNGTVVIDGKTLRINYTATTILLTEVASLSTTVLTASANVQTAGSPISLTATVAAATGTVNEVNFETGDLSQAAAQTNAAILSNPALAGSYSLALQRSNSVANYEIRQNGSTYYNLPTAYYRFLFEYTFNPSEGSVVNFQDTASNFKCALHLSMANTLVFQDIAGTPVATGTTVLAPGQVYAVSAEIGSGSNAPWEIRINGNVEMSGTANLGNNNNGSLKLGGNLPYTATYFYDDVAINALAYPSPVPTGSVQFVIDGSDFGNPVALSDGTATIAAPGTLGVGNHVITAFYSGDRIYSQSANTLLSSQPILPPEKARSSTALLSSANPSLFGQPVTLIAIVNSLLLSLDRPTGAVTFRDGTVVLGIGTLVNGQAFLMTPALGVGRHLITAVYQGDGNFSMSSSATLEQRIQSAMTTVVISMINPSVFGQPVAFAATAPGSPGAGVPTGVVTFQEGGRTLGIGILDGHGLATFTTSTLNAGMHLIAALYGGDPNFGTGISVPVNVVIQQAPTTTLLTSSTHSATAGQAVSFAAAVATSAAGAGPPTGLVTFRDGMAVLGVATLANGQAFLTISGLASGSHMVTAVYDGSTNFSSSTSASLEQTIAQTGATVVTNGGAGGGSSGAGGGGSGGAGIGSVSSISGGGNGAGTSSVVRVFVLAGNGALPPSAGSVMGQQSTSSGTALNFDPIRASAEARPSGAPAGPGSGIEEIPRNGIRPGDLLLPRFEPGLPGREEIISDFDLAGALLTGERPTAGLLPQKETSIAPLATLVPGGAGNEQTIPTGASTDQESLWPRCMIGLEDAIDRRLVVPPESPSGMSSGPEADSRRRGVIDQIFGQGLYAVRDRIWARGEQIITSLFQAAFPTIAQARRHTRPGVPVETTAGPAGLNIFESHDCESIDQEIEIAFRDATRGTPIVNATTTGRTHTLSKMLGTTLFVAAILHTCAAGRSADSTLRPAKPIRRAR